MSVDKFGRYISRKEAYFENFYDEDDYEYYDVNYRRLINLAPPLHVDDAVNKEFLTLELNKIFNMLAEHQKEANTNINAANKIIRYIENEINNLYSVLNLPKPQHTSAVVQQDQPERDVQEKQEEEEEKEKQASEKQSNEGKTGAEGESDQAADSG